MPLGTDMPWRFDRWHSSIAWKLCFALQAQQLYLQPVKIMTNSKKKLSHTKVKINEIETLNCTVEVSASAKLIVTNVFCKQLFKKIYVVLKMVPNHGISEAYGDYGTNIFTS